MKAYNENGISKFDYKKGETVLHGDVILYCEDLPQKFESMKKLDDGILALGEQTGHNHALFGNYELREDINKVKHLRIVDDTFLKHQEHRQILIPPGTYRIGIQREYDHFEKITREVAD